MIMKLRAPWTRTLRRAFGHAALTDLLLAAVAAPTLANDPTCSGPGQPPCSCGFLCFDCDFVSLVLLNPCSDADGFPAFCGGGPSGAEPARPILPASRTDPVRACLHPGRPGRYPNKSPRQPHARRARDGGRLDDEVVTCHDK